METSTRIIDYHLKGCIGWRNLKITLSLFYSLYNTIPGRTKESSGEITEIRQISPGKVGRDIENEFNAEQSEGQVFNFDVYEISRSKA